ncbi:hypothetical protein HMPREF0063_12512 [Aeromicrobium marinum DSM 15272]|uniref:Uncharacterized protein n=1 Tax=Aeromicrobium marinum DSM 15272 TaxID=585531 RepID=E2SEQ3_9ACTN|nr:hypothetical protein [Aeromicrobium marinum]EFQ82350.1 hypothetical protein HMPREF0063_12512 [Aeromicrobium marinum DSM 15272]
MAPVSTRLSARIRADFSPSDAERVLDDLADIPESLPLGESQNTERLQACAVLPAAGDYDDFRQSIALLRIDWRDGLMGTGLEHGHWPRELDRLLGT